MASLNTSTPEGWDGVIDAAKLLSIAENSMSSEIYELMKRSDEVEVVEKAHRRPRFVEDCVREMIAGVAEEFGSLGPEAFVFARQENLETIHQHNVLAERHGHDVFAEYWPQCTHRKQLEYGEVQSATVWHR